MRQKKAGSLPIWRTHSWRTFPISPLVCVITAIATIFLALLVLKLADGSRVDRWPISPTVYLSITATLSNTLLRSAFRSSSDALWWSKLLSKPGVSLEDLHTHWEIAYDAMALFKFARSQQPHLRLRAASLAVLFLAANGPLLQRGVTIELAFQTFTRTEELPIRRQPMWNLTQKVGMTAESTESPSLSISSFLYQDEFDEIITGFDERRPLLLSRPVCGETSVCSTEVVISGFARECENKTGSVREVQPLVNAVQSDGLACRSMGWNITGNSTILPDGREVSQLTSEQLDDSLPTCGWLETFYQLHLVDNLVVRFGTAGWRLEQSLSWPRDGPRPYWMNYTNIIRPDHRRDDILVTRCDFYTAFIEVPIQIVNGSTVIMNPAPASREGGTVDVVEPIPQVRLQGLAHGTHPRGFSRFMEDLYGGYLLFDTQNGKDVQLGALPRRFVNRSSVEERPQSLARDHSPESPRTLIYSVLNPLENFTQNLHELSLRYAMIDIARTPERVAEEETFLRLFQSLQGNGIQEAVDTMKTAISETQTVELQERANMAVYRAHYAYTIIALSLSILTSALIMVSLRDWGRLGRKFSMSPLEIAKAFDAPLLSEATSNATGGDISKQVSDAKVRYGCVRQVDPSVLKAMKVGTDGSAVRKMVAMVPADSNLSHAEAESGIIPEQSAEFREGSVMTRDEPDISREGSRISLQSLTIDRAGSTTTSEESAREGSNDEGGLSERRTIRTETKLAIAKVDEVELPRDGELYY